MSGWSVGYTNKQHESLFIARFMLALANREPKVWRDLMIYTLLAWKHKPDTALCLDSVTNFDLNLVSVNNISFYLPNYHKNYIVI